MFPPVDELNNNTIKNILTTFIFNCYTAISIGNLKDIK
jgi:hypothetical protein